MDAFLYLKRSRALLALLFVLALLFAPVSVRAETEIRSLTGIIEGHQVGGVTIDLVGNIYVADFGDLVWKITPEGERQVFASGLHGASGNAIDNEGHRLQSNERNKMKTTLTVITIITSLFFSACASNRLGEQQTDSNTRIGFIPPNQGVQLQLDLMRDQFTKTMLLPSDGHNFGL